MARTPVIDLFAGCGGLSEGFNQDSSGAHRFDVVLALDNEPSAHQTHLLRTFFHQFLEGAAPAEYYEFLRGKVSLDALFSAYPSQAAAARERVVQWELGGRDHSDVCLNGMIEKRLAGQDAWVLIGGPPCQAYSLAGRSRNRGNANYEAAKDHRHFLYREYLKILRRFRPAVFVMENVPGLLNSKIEGRHVWHRMIEDLVDPSGALASVAGEVRENDRRTDGYHIYSLTTPDRGLDIFGVPMLERDEFVVPCEKYGIPQMRQRVFFLGVRADIRTRPGCLVPVSATTTVRDAISDLPAVRSGLSKSGDSDANWRRIVEESLDAEWWNGYEDRHGVRAEVKRALKSLRVPRAKRGGAFVSTKGAKKPARLADWYVDERIGGVCNHESRAHMDSDLHRYIFAACHALASKSPLRLSDFPVSLLPDHENVKGAAKETLAHSNFADRFAVQTLDQPSRTVVSHISKDGHYYIHPDAAQCRSLTVREAARLQTFPDNYFFMGNRTEQYRQVGNAVPPYLARQIARIVGDVLDQPRLAC